MWGKKRCQDSVRTLFGKKSVERKAVRTGPDTFFDIEKLIHLKCAAGRPKDLEVIGELEAFLGEQRKLDDSSSP